MIAIGAHLVKHKEDIAEIVNRVNAIKQDFPALSGNIVALDDYAEEALTALQADYEAAGLLDEFTKNRPILSALLRVLIGQLLGA